LSAGKHTPGPWRHAPLSNTILGADNSEVVELPPGADPEAEVWWEKDRANARLIAAAPDLLASQQATLRDFEKLVAIVAAHAPQLLSSLSFTGASEAMARAAIAKAVGK